MEPMLRTDESEHVRPSPSKVSTSCGTENSLPSRRARGPHWSGGRQRIGLADKIRARVVPKHEPDAGGVPPVQVLRLAEIRVAAESDPAKPRILAQRARVIQPLGGAFRRRA